VVTPCNWVVRLIHAHQHRCICALNKVEEQPEEEYLPSHKGRKRSSSSSSTYNSKRAATSSSLEVCTIVPIIVITLYALACNSSVAQLH
jgi:hypothetical protein